MIENDIAKIQTTIQKLETLIINALCREISQTSEQSPAWDSIVSEALETIDTSAISRLYLVELRIYQRTMLLCPTSVLIVPPDYQEDFTAAAEPTNVSLNLFAAKQT